MPAPLERTKEKTRGRGRYENYVPWIWASEINSLGTTAEPIDWKHGRTIQCLSEGERMLYYILRWNDKVDDINEQFPLPLETVEIARRLGFKHPKDEGTHMTTDMLVWLTDGRRRAYSLKSSWKDVREEMWEAEEDKKRVRRTIQKLAIEKFYWTEQKVEWRLVVKEDLDVKYADNIRRCVEYYDRKKVHDRISAVKHLIATKQLKVEMHGEHLDYYRIAEQLKEEGKWQIPYSE
jgi:hypothetical protein